MFVCLAPTFVKADAAVVVPNYGLCPAVGIDTIALQMVRALVWVWRHAERCGATNSASSPDIRQAVTWRPWCGDWRSLGAYVPARLVKAAVSVSGLYDLERLRHVPFLADDLKLTPDLVRRLSPVNFPRPEGPLVTALGADEDVDVTNHFTVVHALVDAGEPLHAHVLKVPSL